MPFPDVRALREFYGLLPQPPTDPFQFFLWEILSADTLPARRDLAWQALRRIPALTPDAVFRTPGKVLQATVALLGAHGDERLEDIRATTGELKRHRDRFEAQVFAAAGLLRASRTLRQLAHLPVDMRERALLYAGGYAVLPLDDTAARVVARLEGTALPERDGADGSSHTRPLRRSELRLQRRRARKTLAEALPRDVSTYREVVLYLRHHGEHTCIVVGPHCAVCPLASECAAALAANRARSG